MEPKLKPCGRCACTLCVDNPALDKDIAFVMDYLKQAKEYGVLKNACVSVNAHIGRMVYAMAEFYSHESEASIYALEPEHSNYAILRENVAAINQAVGSELIVAARAAGWNANGPLFLRRLPESTRFYVTNSGIAGRDAITTSGTMLDTVASTPEQRQIDVMCIDAEGAELLLFNGARGVLEANDHMLIMSELDFDGCRRYGASVKQVIKFLAAHQFRMVRPEDEKATVNMQPGEHTRVMFVKGDVLDTK